MMNSPALGIAYVIWLKARWVIGGMLLFILLLALAIRLMLFSDVVEQILCSALLLVFAWAVLLNMLIYSPTDLGSKGSVFPSHMLVLPVRTRALVGWPMLYGTAIHAGLWVLLATTVLRPGGIDAPAGLAGSCLVGRRSLGASDCVVAVPFAVCSCAGSVDRNLPDRVAG